MICAVVTTIYLYSLTFYYFRLDGGMVLEWKDIDMMRKEPGGDWIA